MKELSGLYAADGLAVETYDVRMGTSDAGPIAGDIDFYCELARRAGPKVLELACGTGRVSWPLAAAGFEVTGLDLSSTMLAQAESKRVKQSAEVQRRVRFVEADMTDYALPETFDLAICPFRAFQSLLTPEAQRRALDCAFRQLHPGGRLSLHLYDPRLEWLVDAQAAPLERTPVRHPLRGTRVEAFIPERHSNLFDQVTDERWVFRELDEDGAQLQEQQHRLKLRWSYRWEMRYLLTLAGFDVEDEYSDFRGGPPAYGQEQIWIARRP